MEEQKKAKNVKMNVEKKQNKLTYEQLNDACNQLYQQNQRLIAENNELKKFNMFKRLDYLFKILEFSSQFPTEFVVDCADEIKEAMTIPSDDKEE